MASDSSSSSSSSGTEFADPILSIDTGKNSECVGSQLESMNLSEPIGITDGSNTANDGGDDGDAAAEVTSSNGNEDGVGNGCLVREGLAEISVEEEIEGGEASSKADHPVEIEAYVGDDDDEAAVENLSSNGNEGVVSNGGSLREGLAGTSVEEEIEGGEASSSADHPIEMKAYKGGEDGDVAVEDASSKGNEDGFINGGSLREGLAEISGGEASSRADHPVEIEAYVGGVDGDAVVENASSNGDEGRFSNGGSLREGLAGTSEEMEIEEGEASSKADHPVEMEAREEPPSPTSSGYDGERGSSGGATSTYKAGDASEDEIREDNVDDDTASQHEAAWLPGKRHVDEVSLIQLLNCSYRLQDQSKNLLSV